MDLKPLVIVRIKYFKEERCGMCLGFIKHKFCAESVDLGIVYCPSCALKSINCGVFGFPDKITKHEKGVIKDD